MNYPLISEYIDAIRSAEDNFDELSNLRPILGEDGEPVMSAGGFSVVFKMKDERDGKLYALKCFTKEQEGRTEAYREIAKELKDVSSPYLVAIHFLEKELFVDFLGHDPVFIKCVAYQKTCITHINFHRRIVTVESESDIRLG